MSTFALIHGGGDVGWSWHLVVRALQQLGHDAVAPDLPCDDDTAGLEDYARAVLDAVGDRTDVIVVAHSYGGFTAPLVAERLGERAAGLVLVAAMIPTPGEPPSAWWERTGHRAAVERQREIDGVTGSEDPDVMFFHDVPPSLADEAKRRERGESSVAYAAPWPLAAWPDVPTRAVVCTLDRLFPARFMRELVRDRLGVEPETIEAGHYVALSRPDELASLLAGPGPAAQRVRSRPASDR